MLHFDTFRGIKLGGGGNRLIITLPETKSVVHYRPDHRLKLVL